MLLAYKGGISFRVSPKAERYNGTLVTGDIGSGKTYALSNVIIPESIARGEKVVILDTTGSFADDELRKCHFSVNDNDILKINLAREQFYIGLSMLPNTDEEFARKWADLLVNSLGITGRIQTSMIYTLSRNLMLNHEHPSMNAFKNEINNYYFSRMVDGQETKNYLNLMERLSAVIVDGLFELSLFNSNLISDKKVIIIQLGELDETSKKECGNIILYEIWNHAKEKSLGPTCLVIDEFQSFSLHRGSILERMIRLERKHGLSVALATQYLSDREPDELAVVDMIETKLYFRPPDRDIRTLAKIIECEEAGSWTHILKNLDVGYAVLTGRYEINGNVSKIPLKVKVQAEPRMYNAETMNTNIGICQKKAKIIMIQGPN